MKPIVFVDTETCGLALHDPIWEIAMIRRDESGEEELRFFVEHDPAAALALPDRFRADHDARYQPTSTRVSRTECVVAAASILRTWLAPNEDGEKAVIVGSAPDFDMIRIQTQLGLEQIWNHHLIDAPTLAMGHWFSGRKARLSLPPSLDEAAKMFGIDPRQGRHTAMQDCILAKEIFDRATHGRYIPSEVAA